MPFTGDAALYQIIGADWKHDLGLDSIELMGLAAEVNSLFNLFAVNEPPYLLSSAKVDDWVEMVLKTRQRADEILCFNTSGTSGQTKVIRHTMAHLQREIAFLKTLFQEATCIIPYVPGYSIYGFLLTVGLPKLLQAPLCYPSQVDWTRLPANALIVATPFNWQLLINSLPDMAVQVLGVSAAAPLYSDLYRSINSKGIKLTELYGATETSGVAYRNHWDDSFQFFPYWALATDGEIRDMETDRVFKLMDDIRIDDQGHFTITGRKDKQVKIAGRLVNLDQVALSIKKLANVQECHISAKATGNDLMIQVSLTLFEDGEHQRTDVKKQIRQMLPAHERPRDIYFD
ncbi:AMP-binding protein [Mucilaginibacter flavus]|uniref:AMP-binding protein n=1 Tax=Mucilaginibacter flavus TaxID=931504 RepID=UPI0025B545DF|nr:class I adenylate-forming enzyme family protein [Mucilaginibacter flavus]MDN3584230.1 class I adenylate-forming enzyme family protein [Mucilaginibacter flavus]